MRLKRRDVDQRQQGHDVLIFRHIDVAIRQQTETIFSRGLDFAFSVANHGTVGNFSMG